MSRYLSGGTFQPHEALAAGVLKLALEDAARPGAQGEHARRFLANSAGLQFWCHVASIPTSIVMEKTKARLSDSSPDGVVGTRTEGAAA